MRIAPDSANLNRSTIRVLSSGKPLRECMDMTEMWDEGFIHMLLKEGPHFFQCVLTRILDRD